jgi:hypothetical protein
MSFRADLAVELTTDVSWTLLSISMDRGDADAAGLGWSSVTGFPESCHSSAAGWGREAPVA